MHRNEKEFEYISTLVTSQTCEFERKKCKSSNIDKDPQNVFIKIVKSIEVSEIFNIFSQ